MIEVALSLAIGVIISTVILLVVGNITPGMEVDDLTAAFWAAVVVMAIGHGAMLLLGRTDTSASPAWQFYATLWAVNTLALGFAALAIDGVRVHNPISLVLGGVLLTAANYVVPFVVPSLS